MTTQLIVPDATDPSPPPAIARQTLAILYDAYRELNARKMFWLVLILSGLAMAAFAVVSVQPTGLKIAGYNFSTGLVAPQTLYKYTFNQVIVGYWLTWAATILAIVSTAAIFPDFVSGGAIDLFISKPISRLRLFLTKYACGMLFVFLQVAVFSVPAFFIIRIRGGIWEPGVFLAIPIVLCFFSYLFAIAALVGVLTRSTVATLLVTVIFWAFAFAASYGEVQLHALININERRIETIDTELNSTTQPAAGTLSQLLAAARMFGIDPHHSELLRRRAHTENNLYSLRRWYSAAWPLHLILPKTSETTDLLGRNLISEDEFLAIMDLNRAKMPARVRNRVSEQDMFFVNDEVDAIKRSRSLGYVLGTSLTFEAAVLGLAAWLFCRRDY